MSLVIKAIVGVTAAAVAWGVRSLKTPRLASELPSQAGYHGSTINRIDAKIGDVVHVRGHFFFTPKKELAEDYATGSGISFYRQGEELDEGKPVVLKVTPLDPEKAIWKRGLFGGNSYFVNGTQLQVIDIYHPEPLNREAQLATAKMHAHAANLYN